MHFSNFPFSHALKARITMKDVVSEALLLAFKQLKTHVEEREKDLDDDIQVCLVYVSPILTVDIYHYRRLTYQTICSCWYVIRYLVP